MPFALFPGMTRPPSNLSELSTEDLRKIEGQERENVEARIQWLRDIQALMDGAMVMINQYNTVAAQLSTPVIITNVSATNKSQEEQSKSDVIKTKEGIKTEPSGTHLSYEDLDGATGYTPPKEEEMPEWEDLAKEEFTDEMHEIRRRRLQKFEQKDTPS
ncbi:E3 ubiquitin-protein ligase synoviolin-like [Saccostrea cucullata]|uniref:E3 ubiquitin-protein ligase synoviolin-like n=1 Tax=Saccostrea cuccullata TaxID=36930 RepID=UPI002ED4648E